jgi:mono/diheme cytochrome c family protein
LVPAALVVFAGVRIGTAEADAPPSLARDVEPLFKQQCVLCHNEGLAQAGLRLDSREMALKGGVSGPALVPGNASASLIVKRLLGTDGGIRMPQNMEPWPTERIALVRRWIDEGAPWPEASVPSPVVAAPVPVAAVSGRIPDYARDVAPIFRENCVSCHGPEQQQSLLRLDSRTLALKGGLSGKVIVPGRGGDSPLLRRLRGQITPRMPFQKDALAPDRIAVLQAWIDAGAPGPDDAPAGARVATHWAYVKPVRPPAPPATDTAWARNPIDAFVLARLEKEELRPSPEADRETLLRRVTLDLIGLPPTLAEIDAFVADRTPDAYETVVDRLLASPAYGERYARHWLDVIHFAETHGHDQDVPRENAWPYRDYVIRSFNDDKPYARFVEEQLAGDVLYPDDPQAKEKPRPKPNRR